MYIKLQLEHRAARMLAPLMLFIAMLALIAVCPLPASSVQQFSLFGVDIPSPPTLNARSAILIDAATGTVLFEKNAES